MKTFKYLILIFLSISLISNIYAGKQKQQMKVSIKLLNANDNSNEKSKQMEQLTTFIKKDLQKKLKKSYDVSFINEGETATSEKGLVMIYNIVKYKPGSTAARYIVGFGAGSCSLDIKYEILQDNTSVLSKEDGCGSSRGWRKCVIKLNKNLSKNLKINLK